MDAPSPRAAWQRITAAMLALLFLTVTACEGLGGNPPPRISDVGAEHNRVLAQLERHAPVRSGALTMDAFGGMLRAAENHYVNDLGFDREVISSVTREAVRVIEASGIVYERGGRKYVDLGDSPESLLRVIDYQVKEGQISPRLARELRATYEYAARVQNEGELLKYIDAEFAGARWSAEEQPIVDGFISIAHSSAAYWPGGENEPAGKPKWVTILADALGGALGGGVGALAGPIVAAAGAGLVGAAASHVFGRTAPGFVGGPGVIEGRK